MKTEARERVDVHQFSRVLTFVAGHGLTKRGIGSVDAITPIQWAQFLDEAKALRMIPFLSSAIEIGEFPVSTRQAREVADAGANDRPITLILEYLLLQAVELLTEAEIDYRVLKGPALAHTVYPSSTLRTFGDVDLLIQSDRLEETVELLQSVGFVRKVPQLRRSFDRRFGKGVSMATTSGFELDIHRTIAPGLFGLKVDLPKLFAEPAEFVLEGRAIKTLSREKHLIHACYHAVLRRDAAPLVTLRDIAQILSTPGIDMDEVISFSENWGSRAVVALGLKFACQTLGISPDKAGVRWAVEYHPGVDELRSIHSYSRTSYASLALGMLPAIQGFARKSQFLGGLLWPGRSYMKQKSENRVRRWARASSRLIRGP